MLSTKTDGCSTIELSNHQTSLWGQMAVTQNRGNNQPSLELRPFDRLTLGLIGLGVIFASLGLGEAVYRLAFFDFDEREPIDGFAKTKGSEYHSQPNQSKRQPVKGSKLQGRLIVPTVLRDCHL